MSSWREWIGRAALPLLAASAAWGVYQYNLLFVPAYIAVLSALAFEAVYVALAVTQTTQPRRALAVSLAAVGVSVLYNTLSALFHRRPELLEQPALLMDVALAALHGVPLAIVAYNVAGLLLHAPPAAPAVRHDGAHVASLQAELAQTRAALEDARAGAGAVVAQETITVARRTLSVRQLAALVGAPETTLRRRLAQMEEV